MVHVTPSHPFTRSRCCLSISICIFLVNFNTIAACLLASAFSNYAISQTATPSTSPTSSPPPYFYHIYIATSAKEFSKPADDELKSVPRCPLCVDDRARLPNHPSQPYYRRTATALHTIYRSTAQRNMHSRFSLVLCNKTVHFAILSTRKRGPRGQARDRQ